MDLRAKGLFRDEHAECVAGQRANGTGKWTMSGKMNSMKHDLNTKEVPITPEGIDGFLEHLRAKGRVQGTLNTYRKKLDRLYQALPEDGKAIRRDTLLNWRKQLAEEGLASETINQSVVAANGYLEYMGAREFQVTEKLGSPDQSTPELTRSEYLRLLGAVRILGREQAYLLVKVFGNSDLPVQELPCLTVEAAQAGMVSIRHRCSKEIIRFPSSVCRELLDHARRRGIRTGSIFITRTGNLISRNNVTATIRQLCHTAQVPEEKGNPRCLRKLYLATREGIERNVALLVEQAQERLLEEEQLTVGWEER